MKLIKYILPLWLGILIYTLFSILRGPVGTSAYDQLEVEREKLTANMNSLKLINRELENTRDALMYDKDTIMVYARELGYRLPDERFIRIVGFAEVQRERTEPGRIIRAVQPEHISEKAIKICAFFIAFGSFLCILIPDVLQNRADFFYRKDEKEQRQKEKERKRKVYSPSQEEEQPQAS